MNELKKEHLEEVSGGGTRVTSAEILVLEALSSPYNVDKDAAQVHAKCMTRKFPANEGNNLLDALKTVLRSHGSAFKNLGMILGVRFKKDSLGALTSLEILVNNQVVHRQ